MTTQPQRLVILGAGTGGTLAANRLRKKFPVADLSIDIVDEDNDHVYQPGLLFVPFGLAKPDEIVRPRDRQLRDGITYHLHSVTEVETDANRVELGDGAALDYDVLLVATGTALQPERRSRCGSLDHSDGLPLHGGAPYVADSGDLGDELGFVPTDNATMQSLVRPNIFVLGDAHLGKLMFQSFYWHCLLPGRDIPGIGADMPERGKEIVSSS